MFIDASAIVGILIDEPEAPALLRVIESHEVCLTSPLAIFETASAIMRVHQIAGSEAREIVEQFLAALDVKVVPIDESIGYRALVASERYGKGRHAASLNMGDCFSYACAKAYEVALLYKGNDFFKTDLA